MANRRPYDLRNILIAYNLFQTVFSAWIFYEVSKIVAFQFEFAHHHSFIKIIIVQIEEKPTVRTNARTGQAFENKSCVLLQTYRINTA